MPIKKRTNVMGLHGFPGWTRKEGAHKLKDTQRPITIGRRNFVLDSWGYEKTQAQKKHFNNALLRIDRKGRPTGGFVAVSSWGPLKAEITAKLPGVTVLNSWRVGAGVQDAALKKSYGNAVVRWFFGNVEKLARAKSKKHLVALSSLKGLEPKFLRSMGFVQAGKTKYFVKTL
ncbi:MAG: hypothetical protein QGI60_02090 [archaeon]|nr:hypothetical protein [archaeon]